MTTERAIRILAGSMILLSLGLFLLTGPLALLLAGFVALNLIQSAFTGFCPAEKVFLRCGLRSEGCSPGSRPSAAIAEDRRQSA